MCFSEPKINCKEINKLLGNFNNISNFFPFLHAVKHVDGLETVILMPNSPSEVLQETWFIYFSGFFVWIPKIVKSIEYNRCYSSGSGRHSKRTSNSVICNCQKICSWIRRPKNVLEISKKASFLTVRLTEP